MEKVDFLVKGIPNSILTMFRGICSITGKSEGEGTIDLIIESIDKNFGGDKTSFKAGSGMKRILAVAFAAAMGAVAWAAPALAVSVVAGPAWSHAHRFGLVWVKLTPQAAIWIETADGKYVDTVYVTRRSAKADWRGGKGIRRPEALPVWSRARGVRAADGLYMPDAAGALPDAISGATPAKSFARGWIPPASLAKGVYVVRVELNASYDWDAAYPDKLAKSDPRWTEANGQPSIVWEGRIELGGPAAEAGLAPVGRGDLRGESGAVTPGLEGITSAKELVASIKAEYRP
jgi:hypothetical protein